MINEAEWIKEERKETLNDREKFIHTWRQQNEQN